MCQDVVVVWVTLVLQVVVGVVWTSYKKLRVCSVEWIPRYLELGHRCIDWTLLTDLGESHKFLIFVTMRVPVPHDELPIRLTSKRYNDFLLLWMEG